MEGSVCTHIHTCTHTQTPIQHMVGQIITETCVLTPNITSQLAADANRNATPALDALTRIYICHTYRSTVGSFRQNDSHNELIVDRRYRPGYTPKINTDRN